MPADRAGDVAAILVEGDLLGHVTHGLALLPTYLREIETGSMQVDGDPVLLADQGAALTWDGRRLPGPWLVLRAFEIAAERARTYGTGTVVIRRSHHIACLAAYLKRATDTGLVMLLLSSGPSTASVAPYGGTRGVFSPNPIAVGYPTGSSAVLIDVSTSVTSNNLASRLVAEGRRLPHPWMLDEGGQPSDDPAVLFPPHQGTILPLGGLDSGHKGYGLALMVEAMTSGLAGHGRADPKEGLGASVFLQVLNPDAFAGLTAFQRQTEWVANACLQSPPRPGIDRVRLPGQSGLARREQQLQEGVAVWAALTALQPWASKFGIQLPEPV
jgi:L-lactate dehydrogenase